MTDRVEALSAAPLLEATDGLTALITDILRKYGGTMKGRGDHDIYEALVRYRSTLDAARQSPPLDVETVYRVIADTAWDEATSWEDGLEQHDLRTLAEAIVREVLSPSRGQG